MTERTHTTRSEIAMRHERSERHLKSVIAMIEAGNPCLGIAQQRSFIEKAIVNAKWMLIQDHPDYCLKAAAGTPSRHKRQSIDDFNSIAKFL